MISTALPCPTDHSRRDFQAKKTMLIKMDSPVTFTTDGDGKGKGKQIIYPRGRHVGLFPLMHGLIPLARRH